VHSREKDAAAAKTKEVFVSVLHQFLFEVIRRLAACIKEKNAAAAKTNEVFVGRLHQFLLCVVCLDI